MYSTPKSTLAIWGSPYRKVLQQHVEARSKNIPENIGNIYRWLAEYNHDEWVIRKVENIANMREIGTVITKSLGELNRTV